MNIYKTLKHQNSLTSKDRKKYKKFYQDSGDLFILYYVCSNNSKCQLIL